MLVGSELEKCLSLQFNEVGANKEEEEEEEIRKMRTFR